ncbi:zinc ribbon domain-containing protein [Endozoicomonas acroporae]|uniref:zinc ribbon domain-containing protein n=1 Tax=Endozoicomonas acroporae TaxID=1701104 RepID=UPI003B82D885
MSVRQTTGLNSRTLVGIDRFFPRSNGCSCCGFVDKNLTSFICKCDYPECNNHHDSDINVAENIEAEVRACSDPGTLPRQEASVRN